MGRLPWAREVHYTINHQPFCERVTTCLYLTHNRLNSIQNAMQAYTLFENYSTFCLLVVLVVFPCNHSYVLYFVLCTV